MSHARSITEKQKKLIALLFIIKQPECFPSAHSHSMNKLTLNRSETASLPPANVVGKGYVLAALLSRAQLIWSVMCVYVDQNKGTPPPEMAYPLGIP